MSEQLHELTALDAAARIRAGEISSEELVRACLDRIAAREDEVRAWQHLDGDYAIAEARKADESEPRSPLHGVPFGVKDVIDTGDLPTECGSVIYRDRRPAADAACVAAMRAAGAVLMGKTVSTEFATFTPGKTRNPHDAGHTPGGSSSGSAAAVGSAMVPLAFGNQTAGSLVRPAAFCGIFGLKPTHGTVDLSGIFELVPRLDTLGYMARSVDDLAAFYGIVLGRPVEVPPEDGPGRAPRIGLCRTFHWREAAPETVEAVESAAAFCAGMGAEVAEADMPGHFADLAETHTTIMNAGLGRGMNDLYRADGDRLSERLRQMIRDGQATPDETLRKANDHADRCIAEFGGAMGDRDVFLAPSAPGEAPGGLDSTGNPIFQVVWTLLQVPCVTLPWSTGPNGLPVGVQLIGRRGDDETVLGVARWLETRRRSAAS